MDFLLKMLILQQTIQAFLSWTARSRFVLKIMNFALMKMNSALKMMNCVFKNVGFCRCCRWSSGRSVFYWRILISFWRILIYNKKTGSVGGSRHLAAPAALFLLNRLVRWRPGQDKPARASASRCGAAADNHVACCRLPRARQREAGGADAGAPTAVLRIAT